MRTESELPWTIPDGAWIYSLYANLPTDGNRYEVINGRLTASPAPPTCHQEISGQLLFALHPWAEAHGYEVLPYVGVVLSEEAPWQQYLIPDMVGIARSRRRLHRSGVLEGPPDLIIEIVSRETLRQDWKEKKAVYAHYGIPGSWIRMTGIWLRSTSSTTGMKSRAAMERAAC